MSNRVSLSVVAPQEAETAILLLKDADEGEERIRAIVISANHTTYLARDGESVIGAATMHWNTDESEIIYIAVASAQRGHGYGKAIISQLLEEARCRGVRAVLVGTATTSFDNIAFYQKCGFRVDYVRRDYFSYIQPPIFENGIRMRDMLVLRHEMGEERQ
jgi:ribosomal protein S18 acetylase RimI-like enzyme